MAALAEKAACVPILLPVLKIYSIRYVHYRFSVLAVTSEHSLKAIAHKKKKLKQ